MNTLQKYSFSIGLFVCGYIIAIFASWFTLNYELRSPLVINWQSPIIARKMPVIKTVKPEATPVPKVSPTPTDKPLQGQIEPFPKLLTTEAVNYREKALDWIATHWQNDDLTAFDNIIKKESGYRPDALNEIGAGGICQAYPSSKMPCKLADDDLMCQLEWCNNYIVSRYGTPSEAWSFHLASNWF
jgi:hypothetical protein